MHTHPALPDSEHTYTSKMLTTATHHSADAMAGTCWLVLQVATVVTCWLVLQVAAALVPSW
jgi:hypothetical protein